MYFILRGIEIGLPFRIATEHSKGQKFDDLIFALKLHDGRVKYTFVQAKHKQDPEKPKAKIKLNDLLSSDESDFQVKDIMWVTE